MTGPETTDRDWIPIGAESPAARTDSPFARTLWYVPIALSVVVGVVVSTALFLTLREVETLRIEGEFSRLATERTLAVAKVMETFVDDLRAAKGLFDASEYVDRSEFRRFVTPLLERKPGIRALEWIPRVPPQAVGRYRDAARQDGFDLRIRDVSGVDSSTRVSREYLYPVFYVEPYATNEVALGVDLGSDATRREALERARDSAQPAATVPLALMQDAEGADSVLVFLPGYDRHPAPANIADRRQALVGFVLGVFRLPDLLAEALSTLDAAAIKVAILHDGVVVAEQPRAAPEEGASQADTLAGLQRSETIAMGGRKWNIRCTPTAEFRAVHTAPWPLATLLVGLFASLVLSTHLYVVTRRAELQRELEVSERRYRTLVEHAPEAILILDAEDGSFLDANENACVLLKRTLPELLGTGLLRISAPVQPDGRDALDAARDYLERTIDGETPLFLWMHRDAEGNDVPCEVRLVRLPSPGRAVVRGSITDITERVRGEAKQALMIRELDHRVKNNLATVVALTQQTAADSGSVEELRESLVGRIGAIARVHRALARRKWEGVDLREILEMTLAPYGDRHGSGRVELAGDSLTLSPMVSSALCMAFHELATNASKYGALCGVDGHVDVAWRLGADGALDLEWVESGGPPVEVPHRTGFGSRLLAGLIEHELGGSVQVEFETSGVRCRIHVPLGSRATSAQAIA